MQSQRGPSGNHLADRANTAISLLFSCSGLLFSADLPLSC